MHLVIGNSSQLSHYFPENYVKISSRNIDLAHLDHNWDAVYITFAEQRIYDVGIDYITPNYFYTLNIINSLLDKSNKIVCYTSCELWNELSGAISAKTDPKFYPLTNEYAISKLLLFNKIKELRKIDIRYNKVIFIHPFYFNSIYRSKYFLFGKIFNSILNKEKIIVGNLNFYRDIVHTKYIVTKSIEASSDSVVGSGELTNIKNLTKDLYKANNMSFEEFVFEDNLPPQKEKLIFAETSDIYTYQDLLSDMQCDIIKA